MRKVVLLVAVMAVMLLPGVSWPSSWYIVKNSGNENIKYYMDTNSEYSSENWNKVVTDSTLSDLVKTTSNPSLKDGDNVYVQCGIYSLGQTMRIDKAIKLYGGFSGNEASLNERDISANPSVLSGQNANRVFLLNGDILIDGFTIQDGKYSNGGGILINSGNPEITDCIISGCNADSGGGVYVVKGNAIIKNTTITACKSAENGGGICISGGSPTVTNCLISGNTSSNNSGGIYIDTNATATIVDSTIAHNTASSFGGGIYSNSANIEMTNCTLTANTAQRGGGISFIGGNISSTGCTIINNTASDRGHEIYNRGTMSFSASIIFNPEAGKSIYNTASATLTLTACALTEGLSLTSGTISTTDNKYLPASWNPVMLETESNGVLHTVYRPESGPELSLLRADESSHSLIPETDQLGNSRTKHTIGAIDSLWDGNGGNDTPYIIATPEALNLLASIVNTGRDYGGEYFCLGCDIAYTTENYATIGDESCVFSGIFDGRGYAVKGIRLNTGGEDYCGLFGHVGESGVVKDIALKDIHITGKNHAGGIAGLNEGTITQCRVYDDVAITAQENDSSNHGGIAGTNAGTISACVCGAEITAQEGLTGCENYGGIAGNNTGTITGCLYLGGE